MVKLLKEQLVCVQEIIPGAETRPEDLPAERRQLLIRFAHNGRFFFGTVRVLSPDGKNVLGQVRSLPRADEQARKQDTEQLLALLKQVVDKEPSTPAPKVPPAKDFKPPFQGGPKVGLKQAGPKVGEAAPDFELKFLAEEKKFKLSDNFGKRPTVLLFHSFT